MLFHNHPQLDHDEWNVFKRRRLHFLHLNLNILLPKIDEIILIAKLTNESVTGISESKLDNSVFTTDIQINQYNLLRCE